MTLAPYTPHESDRGDPLWDPAAHAHAMGLATLIAGSWLAPDHLRERPGDVFLLLAIARRAGRDPWPLLGLPSADELAALPRVPPPARVAPPPAPVPAPVVAQVVAPLSGGGGSGDPIVVTRAPQLSGVGHLLEASAEARAEQPGPTSPPPPPPAPGGAGLPPAAGGGGQAAPAPTPAPDPERVAALERLRAAESRVDNATRDTLRRQHELRSVRPQTSAAKIRALAEALEGAALAALGSRPAPPDPPAAPVQPAAQPAEPAPVEVVDPEAEERERSDLLAQLTTIAADLPPATRASLRQQHHVGDLRQLPLDRLRTLVASSRAAMAAHIEATTWHDPGTPTGEALGMAVSDWELRYLEAERPAELPPLAQRAGLPVVGGYAHLDGAPESRQRRYVHELTIAWERA